jgi:hypothetical protein
MLDTIRSNGPERRVRVIEVAGAGDSPRIAKVKALSRSGRFNVKVTLRAATPYARSNLAGPQKFTLI